MGKILCVDFDGVLHSYVSGWQGIAVVGDPPVPGAIGWLRQLIVAEDFEVHIYSSRSKDPAGVNAMREWLENVAGLPRDDLDALHFPTQKPPAWLTIDDRAFRFVGHFPTEEWIRQFRPWTVAGREKE